MINENYPSFGKQYNGEKAIISLTSWKARIKTVGLTLFSLRTVCPDFHIVLVLSIEEFPGMINDLPMDLRILEKAKICEFLWVKENFKVFKKVLIAMDKYTSIPIISADDDMIYVRNYADELMKMHESYPNDVISYTKTEKQPQPFPCGLDSLYPPAVSILLLKSFKPIIGKHCREDDGFYGDVCRKYHVPIHGLHYEYPGFFHDEESPINGSMNRPRWIPKQRFA